MNDVCLRQMMLASPNDVRFANDVCLTAHWGKHRIIAERSGVTSYLRSKCIISPQGDASLKTQGLRLDLFVKVCYNTLEGSDYICEANASYRRKARRTLFLNSKLHSKKQVKRGIGLSFCTGLVISTSQLSKHYPQNVLL